MSDKTKLMIVASFRNFLKDNPYDQVSIADITDSCGLSRQTFYYHFKSTFDIVKWIYSHESSMDTSNKVGYGTWQDKIVQIFRYTLNNKDVITAVYNSRSRDKLVEYYLYESKLGIGIVLDMRSGNGMSPADRNFVVSVAAYSMTGILLKWIQDGMTEPIESIVRRIDIAISAGFHDIVRAFTLAN